MPINIGLSASAVGGALTLNVTRRAGSALQPAYPVLVPFRSTTATLGTVTWGTISSALSITIPSGATLGTTNGVPFRIWEFIDYNGGTPAIGVATCSTPTNIFACASWESTLKTSITISGSATAAGTLYATAGVNLDAVRIIGYCDIRQRLTTAGTWASSCTTLQTFGPGVPKPGAVVQTAYSNTTTVGTTTSASFVALTNGQTQAITPTSTPNLIRATATGAVGASAGLIGFLQFTRTISASTTAIGNPTEYNTAGATQAPSALMTYDAPGVVSAVTYGFQAKTSAGTFSYPPANTGAFLELQEIQG